MGTSTNNMHTEYALERQKKLEEIEQVMAFSRRNSVLSEDQLRQLDEKFSARFKTYTENDDLRIVSDDGKHFTFEEGDPYVNILAYFRFNQFSFPIKKTEWIERNDEVTDLLVEHSSFSEKLMSVDYATYKEWDLCYSDICDKRYKPSRFDEQQLQIIETANRKKCSKDAYNPKLVLDRLKDKVEEKVLLSLLRSFERPSPEDVQYLIVFEYRVKFYEFSDECPNPTEVLRFFLDELLLKFSEEPLETLQETIDYFESLLSHVATPRAYFWSVFVSDRPGVETDVYGYSFYDFTTIQKEASHA